MSHQQTVEIVSTTSGLISVKPSLSVLCPSCKDLGHCRTDWLGRKNKQQTFEIAISEPISVEVGKRVVLEVDPNSLSSHIAKLYIPLILGLVGPIVLGHVLGWNEGLQLMMVLVGILIGWVVGRSQVQNFQIRIKQ